jgi:hypothetical protein
MDYKVNSGNTGGADACTNLADSDNAGLTQCLYAGASGLYTVTLLSAYQTYCSSVSLADFLVIAAEAVMTWSRKLVVAASSSAVSVDFASRFKYGRTTSTTCGFVPGAQQLSYSWTVNLGILLCFPLI